MFYGLGDGETYNYKKHDEYYSNSCQKFYSKYLTSPFDVVWDTSCCDVLFIKIQKKSSVVLYYS